MNELIVLYYLIQIRELERIERVLIQRLTSKINFPSSVFSCSTSVARSTLSPLAILHLPHRLQAHISADSRPKFRIQPECSITPAIPAAPFPKCWHARFYLSLSPRPVPPFRRPPSPTHPASVIRNFCCVSI